MEGERRGAGGVPAGVERHGRAAVAGGQLRASAGVGVGGAALSAGVKDVSEPFPAIVPVDGVVPADGEGCGGSDGGAGNRGEANALQLDVSVGGL